METVAGFLENYRPSANDTAIIRRLQKAITGLKKRATKAKHGAERKRRLSHLDVSNLSPSDRVLFQTIYAYREERRDGLRYPNQMTIGYGTCDISSALNSAKLLNPNVAQLVAEFACSKCNIMFDGHNVVYSDPSFAWLSKEDRKKVRVAQSNLRNPAQVRRIVDLFPILSQIDDLAKIVRKFEFGFNAKCLIDRRSILPRSSLGDVSKRALMQGLKLRGVKRVLDDQQELVRKRQKTVKCEVCNMRLPLNSWEQHYNSVRHFHNLSMIVEG